MANIFEFLSKDGNITSEKARKSRQMPFHDKTAYVWMGMLPLKKRVNRDKCSFATKQRMFGVFAIDEILRYRGTRFPGSRTLCHPGRTCATFLLEYFRYWFYNVNRRWLIESSWGRWNFATIEVQCSLSLRMETCFERWWWEIVNWVVSEAEKSD